MKTNLVINLMRASLSIFILLGSLTVLQAQSKTTKGNSLYFDNVAYSRGIEDEVFALLKNSTTHLDTAKAKIQLMGKAGAVATITKTTPLKKVMKSKDLVNHLRKAAVVFGAVYDCGNCNRTHLNSASGYVLDESGIIATNHHVVEAFSKSNNTKNLAMVVGTFDGKAYLVTEILAADDDSDLCIVKVDTRGDKLTPLALGNPAEQGDEVFVMSNPNQMLYYFTKGIVARNYMGNQTRNNLVGLPSMDITADYSAGSSGAAIVDVYGNLVSTVSSTRSIYYNQQEQKSLQMVVKQTKPVVLLEKLIKFK